MNFKTNSKQYPEVLLPIEEGQNCTINVRYDRGVIILRMKNQKIVFMNRVIKEIQLFIKEVKSNIVKAKHHPFVEPVTLIIFVP